MNILTNLDPMSNEERLKLWAQAMEYFGEACPQFPVEPRVKINLATQKSGWLSHVREFVSAFVGWLVVLGVGYWVYML